MLASEHSEGVCITTGYAMQVYVAGGDPYTLTGRGSPSATIDHPLSPVVPATALATLVSLAGTTGYSKDTLRVSFRCGLA